MKINKVVLVFVLSTIIISGCGEKSQVENVKTGQEQTKNIAETNNLDKDTLINDLRDSDPDVQKEAADSLEKLGWDDKNNTNYVYYLIIKERSDELEKMGIEPIINALKEDEDGIYDKSSAIYALNRLGWRPRRIQTGSIDRNSYTGEGTIEVKNGVDWDAIVILAKEDNKDEIESEAYIRSNDSWTISKIPDGNYKLYFKLGKDWDNDVKKFSIVPEIVKFDDPFKFDTKPNILGNSYTQIYTVTLYGVVGGNARTKRIKDKEFPKIN